MNPHHYLNEQRRRRRQEASRKAARLGQPAHSGTRNVGPAEETGPEARMPPRYDEMTQDTNMINSGVYDGADPQMIAQQAEMFQQFEHKRDETAKSLAETATTCVSTQGSRQADARTTSRWSHQDNSRIRTNEAVAPSPSPSPPRDGIPRSIQVPDSNQAPRKAARNKRPKTGLVEVCPDTFVHIHSTRRAREAIAQGQATIVRCSSCRKRFQIAQSAEVLYCTSCGSLTPIHQPLQAPQPSANNEDQDRRLAEQLQQEYDAAAAKAHKNRDQR